MSTYHSHLGAIRITGRKVMVALLGGPKKLNQLRPFGSKAAVSSQLWRLQKKHLVEGRGGTWRLTQEGITKATQFDYDLKVQNRHPDQEPEVTKPEGTKINVVMRSEPHTPTDWQVRHIEFLEKLVMQLTEKPNPQT